MFSIRRAASCFAWLTLILLFMNNFHSSRAILNCFNPNMFKFNKAPFGQSAPHVGERANWYPTQQGYTGASMNYGGYMHQPQQSPMKMLFQPKWKGGSLFGPKMGWNNWKMNQNFYRPNYGNYIPSAVHTQQGYQFNEHLNVAPFSIPSPLNPAATPIPLNDGWSAIPNLATSYNQQPIQQTPITNYDTTTYSAPLKTPTSSATKQPLLDPYGIKGALSKTSSTTKNILLADYNGNRNLYSSYLVDPTKNYSFGYSYPANWYSKQQQAQINYDSPARIAQQLFKYNLRRQRLEKMIGLNNMSAPLVRQVATGSDSFSILDEPRFVGFGTVDKLDNDEARLSCSFNEAIDQTDMPIWTKFVGIYNSSQVVNGKNLPPFNCEHNQCRTQQIGTYNDNPRFRFDNGPATSTLIIDRPKSEDFGIYRCSAFTKTINNNPLETVYQVVRFGSLK